MTNPFEVLDDSIPPADVLANTVRQRSTANSEPQWLVHSRREALDAYLSLAPEENQQRVSRQLLLGQTAMDDLHDGPRESTSSLGAAADSDVANRIRSERLETEGVVLMDLRRAVIDHSDLVREYLGSLTDPTTRWAEALNTAIWSRGHFVYIPESIRVEGSFQPYDQTNASRMESFERTLIVAAPESSFGFVEGCSAPIFTMDSFRAPLTEVVVLEGASVTHATIGNYTRNVLTTVNRRAVVQSSGSMTWIEGGLGPASSVGVPAIELSGTGARGEIITLRFASLESGKQELGGDLSFRVPQTSARVVIKVIGSASAKTDRIQMAVSSHGDRGTRNIEIVAQSMEVAPSAQVTVAELAPEIITSGPAADWIRIKTNDPEPAPEPGAGGTAGGPIAAFADSVVRWLPLEYSVELDRMIKLRLNQPG